MHMDCKVSVIICAAGKGERADFNKNKLLAPLFGAPALWHTLKKFDMPEIDEVIVTSSTPDLKEISALCAPFGYKIVTGGKTRADSVKNALAAVTGDIVLIHDGARPFVTTELITKCIQSVKKFGSGVCAVKITDTVVYAEYGELRGTLERDKMYRAQTPQAFYTDDIKKAYELAGDSVYTDDSSVYGAFIAPPRLVDGDESNIKLTFKKDFPQEYATVNVCSDTRAGLGCDVHCFGDGRGITLGGVKIPCGKSLIAHSDGDVVYHALMDALLSAAGLRDIGCYFPDSDPQYKNADSGKLLNTVVKLIYEAGYTAVNASVAIQAETPRLSPYIDKMKNYISRALDISPESVGITCGTGERLGFVGEGLGIYVNCAVTVKKIPNN